MGNRPLEKWWRPYRVPLLTVGIAFLPPIAATPLIPPPIPPQVVTAVVPSGLPAVVPPPLVQPPAVVRPALGNPPVVQAPPVAPGASVVSAAHMGAGAGSCRLRCCLCRRCLGSNILLQSAALRFRPLNILMVITKVSRLLSKTQQT